LSISLLLEMAVSADPERIALVDGNNRLTEAHRALTDGADEVVAKRVGSIGRPVPGIEVQVRDDSGRVLGPNVPGELFVRGSRTPDRVVFRDELPTNATGKLLRRELVDSLRSANAEY
jgi:acyl-coenzyme A synthetase/AMP-(fatty) acid ligase